MLLKKHKTQFVSFVSIHNVLSDFPQKKHLPFSHYQQEK